MTPLVQRIAAHPFCGGMDRAHLALLADGAEEARFRPGDLIFRTGDPAELFYLAEEGRVAIEAHEHARASVTVQEIGPGEALGWSWLFPPHRWQFHARALQPARLVALDALHLLASAERDREFGFELMLRGVRVITERLQAVRRQALARKR